MDVKCPASCLVGGNCRWCSSSAFSEEKPESPLSITEAAEVRVCGIASLRESPKNACSSPDGFPLGPVGHRVALIA